MALPLPRGGVWGYEQSWIVGRFLEWASRLFRIAV
jgi:hypothetical protein